jgi:hypothetical protein
MLSPTLVKSFRFVLVVIRTLVVAILIAIVLLMLDLVHVRPAY